MKKNFKKWVPTCGDTYYYITQSGTVATARARFDKGTIFRIANKNCFKSYKQAHNVLKRLLDDLQLPRFSWGKTELIISNSNYPVPNRYLPKPNRWKA